VLTKVVVPVVVAVIGAVLVTALTPVGEQMRELFFPTKATVRGSVVIAGTSAAHAELELDDDRSVTADEAGSFLIDDVGDGDHTLLIRADGGKPREYSFEVERGDTARSVGSLELEPLVRLGYVAKETLLEPGQDVEYEVTLWLVGDRGAIGAIRSVIYELPAPLPSEDVRGKAGREFCFRVRRTVAVDALASSGASRQATADVELDSGGRFEIQNFPNLPGTDRPPSCAPSEAAAPARTERTPPQGTTSPPPTTNPPVTIPPTSTERVEVPNVVGKTLADARSALLRANLHVSRREVDSSEPEGVVTHQNPLAGRDVPEGTTIALSVSRGPRESEIPDVTSQDESSAVDTLEENGFTVQVDDEAVDDPSQDGIVLRQDPPGGTKAETGKLVILVVGRLSE
jgi:PASTA domain